MTTDIVRHQNHAPAPIQHGGALSLGQMTPREAWLFCESLANTPLLPDAYRKNPSSVLWALEYGRALGLDVVTTITTIHVIKGKPCQSADLMLSRTRSAGHKVRIRQELGSCTVSIWRSDDPDFENTITWTYDDAVTAGLCEMRNNRPYSRSKQNNEPQNWEKYPRAMLRARAISECVRTACPEVLHGAIYTPEELGARVDLEGLPVEAEVTQLRQVQPGDTDPWTTPAPSPEVTTTDPVIEPHGPAQDLADEAQKAASKERFTQLWGLAKTEQLMEAPVKAPDTERIDELGQYLTRRAKDFAGPEPQANRADDGITDAEVLAEGETEADTAERELRAAAAKVGLTDLEGEFERSYGLPISEAGAQQMRAMTAILTGSAA